MTSNRFLISLGPSQIQGARIALAVSMSVIVAAVAAGCSALGPTRSAASHTPLRFSRDGVIQYRPLEGWLDVSSDSSSTDRTIWLVRADFVGTLSMREIHVDASVRTHLGMAQLVDVARLAASLETGGRGGLLLHDPEPIRVNGKEVVVYDVDYRETGDKVRAIVLSAADRVYQVSVLVNGSAQPKTAEEILGVLDGFVADLRW